MTESIDVSRSPRGLMAASALVKAVANVGDLAEHHYLEIKGPLDLSSRTTGAKIAKFILGAANRGMEKAVTAFGGCATMIIGVSGGEIAGMPPVEVLDISKRVQPFLGAGGPLWDAIWVPITGSSNQALVIVVEPPKLGQGPFACRANGDGVMDGRVYVRGDGETREATAEELYSLIDRGQVAPTPPVDFEVQLRGDIRPIALNDDLKLEALIEQTKVRLMEALSSRNPPSRASLLLLGLPPSIANSVSGHFETPEDRSKDEYLQELCNWEEQIRAIWPSAVPLLIGRLLSSPIISITNRTSTFFHDVQVKVHLEGNVFGAEFRT